MPSKPKKKTEEKQSRRIHVPLLLTPDEKSLLYNEAFRRGMSFASWARGILLEEARA